MSHFHSLFSFLIFSYLMTDTVESIKTTKNNSTLGICYNAFVQMPTYIRTNNSADK